MPSLCVIPVGVLFGGFVIVVFSPARVKLFGGVFDICVFSPRPALHLLPCPFANLGRFFMHPTLTEQTFTLFSCKQLGVGDDDFYLTQDMQIRCYTPEHIAWMITLGIPMLVVYVVGIPFFVFYLLHKHQRKLHDPKEPGIKRRLFFLYTGYEREWWFWEVLVAVRKLMLVAVTVFWQNSIKLQAHAGLMLIVVSLTLHIYAKPFLDDRADLLEFLSLAVSFITFFFGLILWVPAVTDFHRVAISVFIFLSNAVFVCYALRLVYNTAKIDLRDRCVGAGGLCLLVCVYVCNVYVCVCVCVCMNVC
jgi:hypothetical protein